MAYTPTDRISQENASALHFLLAPVRFLMGLLKLVGATFLLSLILCINYTGWIIDIGPRSEHSRLVHIAAVEHSLCNYDGTEESGCLPWITYDIDYRRQPDLKKPEYENDAQYQNIYWRGTPDGPEGREWSEYGSYKTFSTKVDGHPTTEANGIPYCLPDYALNSLDMSLGSWTDRGDDALDRKSARMRSDYEAGGIIVSALRSAIIHLKLHRPLDNIPGIHIVRDGTGIGRDSYCNALGGTHETRYGDAGAAAYRAVSQTVVLRHAPVITIRFVGGVPGMSGQGTLDFFAGPASQDRTDHGMEVTGICLKYECDDGLTFGTTYAADLFSDLPPLTPEQLDAENAIYAMSTQAFWAQAARENGVTSATDLTAIESFRQTILPYLWKFAPVPEDPTTDSSN